MRHLIVFITTPSAEEGARLGRTLLEERLAACVNAFPVQSAYWWRGTIEEAAETLLVVKTVEHRLEALTARVRALHTYSVPEVVAFPIVGGNADYLRWIEESVAP